MKPCYCGHPHDAHVEAPPWPHTPEVSPDGVLSCTVSHCPCEGYEPADRVRMRVSADLPLSWFTAKAGHGR